MKIGESMAASRITCTLAVLLAFWTGDGNSARAAQSLGDILWVWATPDRAKPGAHTLDTFAQASAAQRAELLGTPHIILAGSGLPQDLQQADRLTAEVAKYPHLVWEIAPDGGEMKPPFAYDQTVARLARLARKYPQIEGVLVDDMTSVGIDKGFKPEHLRRLRRQLAEQCPKAKLWGVLYSMNFGRENVKQYIDELDVINLWVWHAEHLADLEKHVAHCEATFPGKPIVLGLYLRDYGRNKPMPQSAMERQCETARRLAHAGRIRGIVFLTIDDDPPIARWTADWIRRVGPEPLGKPGITTGSNVPSGDPETGLTLSDPSAWHFVGGSGPWTESGGVIRPPDQRNLHSRAFAVRQAYGDFTADYEFRGDYRETGTGAAAFIFRASDVNHGYMVYCPWGGQQLRAKHFWVQLMRLEGDGYLRSLKSVWVPGVPSETDRWYKIRLEAKGPAIRVTVDGRRAIEIVDGTYTSGAVGLAGYGWYGFRNVKVSGVHRPIAQWDRTQKIPVHHFTVGLDDSTMPSGCMAPNGDVLLAAGGLLVRSKDKGRTWQSPEKLPEKLGAVTDYGNTMFAAQGRLFVETWRDRTDAKKEVPEITILESTDHGATWSDPARSEVAAGWPEVPAKLVPYGPMVQTADGTWVRFLLGGAAEGSRFSNVVTWSATHCKAYAIRSTDRGKRWSRPIEVDQPSWSGQARGTIVGSLDLTEVTGVAIGNRIMAVVRPIYSPYMWQLWSEDSGANWDAAARTTFPGYAQSMARTQAGVIAVAHRFPQYSINLSRDDGLNWDDGTVIDYPAWAMGCLLEVEPDIFLATYMNWEHKSQPLLAQLIRITPKGIEPVAARSR
jgi:hypothetical protein